MRSRLIVPTCLGAVYSANELSATTMTLGEEIRPALTAVSPSTSAPTIDSAIPTARGIRTPASRMISNRKMTNSVSASGVIGRPATAFISVTRNLSGIIS